MHLRDDEAPRMSATEQRDSNQDLDEWTEWAAYNLAAGVDRDKVRARMIAGGFRSDAAAPLADIRSGSFARPSVMPRKRENGHPSWMP